MTDLLPSLRSEIALYGAEVVAAFGEYVGQQHRILQRIPHLRQRLALVREIIGALMEGDGDA